MVMRRAPVDSSGHITFGKHFGSPLSSIPENYIKWYLSIEPNTSHRAPFIAELDRRNGKAAPVTIPTQVRSAFEEQMVFGGTTPAPPYPLELSPIAQKLLDHIKTKMIGKPKAAVFELFDSKKFGTYAETSKAWTELTRSGIKLSKDGKTFGGFTDDAPLKQVEDEAEHTIFTKDMLTAHLADAYDRGFKEAVDVLEKRIKALDEGEYIKGKLRKALKQEPVKLPEHSAIPVFLTHEQLQELILQTVSLGYADAFELLGNRIHSFHYSDLDNDALYNFLILGTGSGNVTPKEDWDPMDRKRGKKWWSSSDNRKSFRRT